MMPERAFTRLLLVEDNPGDARLIRIMLEEDGYSRYDIGVAGTMAAAEKYLSANEVDIILLDLALPDSSGEETVARIKAIRPDVAIVILTGNEDEQMVLWGARHGCQDYLVKGNIDSHLLHRVVTYAIERQRAEDELAKAKTEAEEANDAKTQFLANLSHRLRTPLNTIIGLSEMIQTGSVGTCDNPRILEYVNDIDISGRAMHTLVTEILEVSQAEAALKSRDQTYRQLVDMSPDCILVSKGDKIILINAAGAILFGVFNTMELEGKSLSELVHPDYRFLLEDNCEALIEERGAAPMKFLHPAGMSIDAMVSAVPFSKKEGSVLLVARNISDLTKSTKEVVRQNKRLASILDTAVDAIVVTDRDGIIETFNSSAQKIFGYGEKEAIGQSVNILIPEHLHSKHDALVANYDAGAQGLILGKGRELSGKRKDGGSFPIEVSLSETHLDDRVLYTAVIRDITERKRMEDRLTHHATHDDLTDIPNRTLFNDRLEQALIHAERKDLRLAVLFLDLDGFKTINDSLGHEAGDDLLREVSRRMVFALRKSDTVARFGGDEFVLIFPEIDDHYGAVDLTDRLVESLSAPFRIGGREMVITASVGISTYPKDGTTPSELIRHADVAMLQAKQEGRNLIRFYDASMNKDAVERLNMEHALRKSIADRELTLYYQPQIDIRTGRIVGVEALSRWNHLSLGHVSPVKFIPLAEETGLIIPLGAWVVHQACKDIRKLHDAGSPIRVAVNLSARQFGRVNITALVSEAIEAAGIEPGMVDLEITESTLMQDPESVVRTLEDLKKLGVHISIDDFGTGYSSLIYLKRFPVDTIKIDQAFVREMIESADDRAIVNSVINLAHSMDMRALAEGVEVMEQHDLLLERGCDEIQGFMYSKPLPFDELVTFVKDFELKLDQKKIKKKKAG